MKHNKGFTLIELLVVIAIIGVLSAIVLAALGSGKNKGNDSKVKSQLKSMMNQAQLYTGLPNAQPAVTTAITTGDATISRNLFTSNIASENGLLRLIAGLPSGTIIYYASDGVSPVSGGKWFFGATTSVGAMCIDYTSYLKTFTGTIPTTTTSTWTTAAFTSANSTTYTCN